ncbi:MAG TPA: nucleotidyltransferase domain-containing protein [Candidatus Latescibacteria bacterium]|nr:nucleotidyltransferase domain-containing protein [Candidatus Latescibacterota bacterium]
MTGTSAFSTHLLDRAIDRQRQRREKRRQERLTLVLQAIDKLSCRVRFEEAYIFGSLAKPHRYFEGSDVDVAFVGLRDEDFFQAIAFLSRELGTEVDVVQLEGHPLREKILQEAIRWKRSG